MWSVISTKKPDRSISNTHTYIYIYIYTRAVSINALIYAINLAAIKARKYFNATLFTSGVRWSCCTPLLHCLLLDIHRETEGDVSVQKVQGTFFVVAPTDARADTPASELWGARDGEPRNVNATRRDRMTCCCRDDQQQTFSLIKEQRRL